MRVSLVLFELLWLTSSLGCQQPKRAAPKQSAPSTSALLTTLAPRTAGRFQVTGGTLRQEQPRLPDTGEWRCAEREGVVWCAGGEAAAGVVAGPPDPGYRCGPRWSNGAAERVCIDEHPDYPDGDYQCRFEQETRISRVCRATAAEKRRSLPARALPACWLDRDCPAGHCDRGACGCAANPDCRSGRCESGVCVEVKP